MHIGTLRPTGHIALTPIRGRGRSRSLDAIILDALRDGLPLAGLSREVARWRVRNMRTLARGLRRVMLARLCGIPTFFGELSLVVRRGDGTVVNFGLASTRVVTDTGVGAIVDAFQNTVELETFNYHGIGTGAVGEAVGDTALGTELTTEYTGNVRATGAQSEPAANQYRTVGTNTLDSGSPVIREHGVFTQAATGGGVLLDRSVFAAITLVGANGDGLQSTYTISFSSGG